DRFAALVRRDSQKWLVLVDDPRASGYREQPTFLSGGGGLVSTGPDYLRFCRMLLGGGELDGVRVLSRKTVELMASNHLPGGGDLRQFALPGGYGAVRSEEQTSELQSREKPVCRLRLEKKKPTTN